MKYDFKPENVCPTNISFELDGDIVKNVEFSRGCPGNLTAIPKLIDGWTVDEIEEKLSGITCAGRPTSCVDQLVKGLRDKLSN